MIWKPKYTISNKLLVIIREIGESLGELKSFHLTNHDLAKLEIEARELSSYASTSIEGNPLPLTDVKRLLKRHTKKIYATPNVKCLITIRRCNLYTLMCAPVSLNWMLRPLKSCRGKWLMA